MSKRRYLEFAVYLITAPIVLPVFFTGYFCAFLLTFFLNGYDRGLEALKKLVAWLQR